jgi:hypothetical protein
MREANMRCCQDHAEVLISWMDGSIDRCPLCVAQEENDRLEDALIEAEDAFALAMVERDKFAKRLADMEGEL